MTDKVVAFGRPAVTKNLEVISIVLAPDPRARVVELAAEWGCSVAEAAARVIALYIEAEADA